MTTKSIICLILIGFLFFESQAQELKIAAIPFAMHLENIPKEFQISGDNSMRITAQSGTNLFISPDGRYKSINAPKLLFKPDSDFILTAGIKPDFKSPWDAGALLIYNDSLHFAKFCFETDFQGEPRIVSVVCNETADDCNSMPVTSAGVVFRITGSTGSNTFGFYYLTEEKQWFPIRMFKLDKSDNIRIGFSAQSPTGKGCSVDFTSIELQQRKINDMWKGD